MTTDALRPKAQRSFEQGLLLSKAFYFSYFGAMSALMPFLALYYQSLGLAPGQIGVLSAIAPFVVLFGAPLWSGLADVSGRHRRVLQIAIAGTIVMTLVLSRAPTFLWLIPVIALHAFFSSPIVPQIDSTVTDLLGTRRDLYGRLRLWGTIGWGLVAPITGWLIDRHGLPWIFTIFVALMIVCLLLSWQLPAGLPPSGAAMWRGLRTLLAQRSWVIFLSGVFICGVTLTMLGNFLFLYLKEMNADETFLGLLIALNTVSEVPAMFFGDRLLKRWGVRGLLIIALALLGLRTLAYSFLLIPWPAVLLSPLHGPAFAALLIAGVSYANEVAPPGLKSSAQGMFIGVLMGLGGVSGALLGGWLFEHVGAAIMFRATGIALLIAAFLFTRLRKFI